MDFSKWKKPFKESSSLGKILRTEIIKEQEVQTLQLLIRTDNHFGRLSYNKLNATWKLDRIISPFNKNGTHDLNYFPSKLTRLFEDEPELFFMRTESGVVCSRLIVSQMNFK